MYKMKGDKNFQLYMISKSQSFKRSLRKGEQIKQRQKNNYENTIFKIPETAQLTSVFIKAIYSFVEDSSV